MKMNHPLTAVLGLLVCGAPFALAETITRGPYLQMLAPDAITVRWQTDVPSESRVQFGSAPNQLAKSVEDKKATVEHEVRLTGLKPSTTYYYAVGNTKTTLTGGDESFRFKTAPPVGSNGPVRIWVLGDSGTGGTKGGKAEMVRDGYEKSPLFKDPDVWLMLGDNAYPKGTEEETTRAIFHTYPMMLRKAPLWSTYGNHDSYTAKGAPYFNAFTFPQKGESGGQPSGTENYYSFDHANIHFVCLDSEVSKNRAAGGAMLTWLESDLAATKQKWIIAFFHHPPYTKGSHDSDSESAHIEMRQRALPILEANGVDLVLSGHSHCYERSMLIDGHYGKSTTFDPATMALDRTLGKVTAPPTTGAYQKKDGGHNGTVYIVGGNSGKAGGGKLNHPVMLVSKILVGSLAIDVAGDRMDVWEIGADGKAFDEFTILKAPGAPAVPARSAPAARSAKPTALPATAQP